MPKGLEEVRFEQAIGASINVLPDGQIIVSGDKRALDAYVAQAVQREREVVKKWIKAVVYFADKGWGVRTNKVMQAILDKARAEAATYNDNRKG